MTIARFFESILVRDLFSYLLPGFLVLLIVDLSGLDRGISETLIKKTVALVGTKGVAFLMLGISYVVGYLLSTVLFYLRGRVKFYQRPALPEIRAEISHKLTEKFGEWTKNAERSYLSGLCLHYVELKKPDFYFEKIERRVVLRNFEISLASVFLVMSFGLAMKFSGWEKIAAILPLILAHLLLLSSKNLDSAIDRLAFSTFYSVAIVDSDKKKIEGPNNANAADR